MSALHVLDQARRRPANPRLGFLDDRIRLPDIMTLRLYLSVEILMIDAAWADRRDFAAVLAAALRACSDDGRYGSTDIVVGGLAMKRASVEAGGEIDRIMAAEARVIARARNMPPLGRSNQHATSLAIGALSQFAHHERRRLSRRSP